jgi:hypothetical protein
VAGQADINTLHLRQQLHILRKPEVRNEDDQVYLFLSAQNVDDRREFFSPKGEVHSFAEGGRHGLAHNIGGDMPTRPTRNLPISFTLYGGKSRSFVV